MDTPDRDIERAQLQTQAAVTREAERLAADFRQAGRPEFKTWDKKTCFECGESLPPKRIEMGRVRCVDCQSDVERARR